MKYLYFFFVLVVALIGWYGAFYTYHRFDFSKYGIDIT